MSSFVSRYPVIRALLRRFREHNIEYAAVAPFQTAFSTLFTAIEGYAVNMEQSVDRNRYRVDLFIQGLNPGDDTLYPILVGEGKGGGRSPREVEGQVWQRAVEAIDGHEMKGIFAFTWLGEAFRFWYVSAEDRVLQPVDQRGSDGSHRAYIPLDSREGECIVSLSQFVKENRPMRATTVVPSQNIPSDFYPQANQPPELSANYEQDNTNSIDPFAADQSFPDVYYPAPEIPTQYEQDNAHSIDSSATNQPFPGVYYPPPESSTRYEQDNMHSVDPSAADQSFPPEHPDRSQGHEMEIDDSLLEAEGEAGPSTGPSNEVHRHRKVKSKQVTIERRENSSGYKFAWKARNDSVKTERDEWEKTGNVLTLRGGYHGYKVWGYKP